MTTATHTTDHRPRRRVAAGTVMAGRVADLRIELAAFDDRSAADDHSKTKDPLPPRPRGPHPYNVPAVR
jgi:hypothetical protein